MSPNERALFGTLVAFAIILAAMIVVAAIVGNNSPPACEDGKRAMLYSVLPRSQKVWGCF